MRKFCKVNLLLVHNYPGGNTGYIFPLSIIVVDAQKTSKLITVILNITVAVASPERGRGERPTTQKNLQRMENSPRLSQQ